MKRPTDRLPQLLALLAFWLLASLAQAVDVVTYLHTDVAGTPLLATDAGGAVVWKENYQPFGGRLNHPPAGDNDQWFAGKPYDASTGLSYFGARYYDPLLGRFMGMDPAPVDPGDIHGLSKYSYGNNNPYRYVDPDGRAVETVIDVISLGLSIAAFRQEPSLGNGLGVAYDALATAVPFLPAGFGIIKNAGRGSETLSDVLRASDAAKGLEKAAHGNKIDSRPATLYEKYDKDGNFLKHGITKHEDPAKRYTAKQIDGGTVVRIDCGPRCEMIKNERDLVERRPGPDNREPWAGKRLGE
jgi:RHS repeat-associated protein